MDRKQDRKNEIDPTLTDEFRRELEGEATDAPKWSEPFRASGKMHGGGLSPTDLDE